VKRLIGAHMPTSGGLHKAILNGAQIGCTAVQVFTSSPQQWKSKEITDETAKAVAVALETTAVDFLISHDSYLVNLAAVDDTIRKKSIDSLCGELIRCATLSIPYAVSHMGSHLGEGEAAGLKKLAAGAKSVLANTPKDVAIAMETTAGQGTNLGYRFEHLASVIEANKGDARLAVCLDTCHVFAAGYDITSEEGYEFMLADFDRLIGFDRLVCIHANDSKYPLGSKRDRHEHIGEGYIGKDAFRRIVTDSRIAHAPIVIETPDAEKMHAANVKRLKSYVKRK
jgi:deoxyribonuclease-4